MGVIRNVAGSVLIASGLTVGLSAISDIMASDILSNRGIDSQNRDTAPALKATKGDRVTIQLQNALSHRNPSGRTVNSKAEIAVSTGTVDERRPVRHEERAYDVVLYMSVDKGSYGTAGCTATISDFEGFDLRLPGTAISTSAHCFDITRVIDPKKKTTELVGRVTDPQKVTFKGSYLDANGDVQTFEMQADAIWVNPLYIDNGGEDTAIVYTTSITPTAIKPAHVLVPDYLATTKFRKEFDKAISAGNIPRVTVAGHAGDKPYLTTHENAQVRTGDTNTATMGTLADFGSGASGGPVFESNGENDPIAFTADGKPIMLAVNKSVYDKTDSAIHSHFDDIVLDTVPFLKREGTLSDKKCVQMVEITATSLNMRSGPSTAFNKLSVRTPDPEFIVKTDQYFAIPNGKYAMLHGTTNNELGEEWGFVSYNNRSGYVSLNASYVNVYPQACLRGVTPEIK